MSLLLIGDLDALRVRSQTVPSQCRADDGTGNLGRYDRRMETWVVTLLVAGIAAIASVSVAWLNVRGESIELRQLKAINEALEGMPTTAPETIALRVSRDKLAARVAAWVEEAPARRRLGWSIAVAVIAVAITVVALALSGFDFTDSADMWNVVLAIVTTVAAAVVSFIASGSTRRIRHRATYKQE
ncbi:hypothetical protein MRBLWO14_000977 [Microbacterium sp. LWO14-1.2]